MVWYSENIVPTLKEGEKNVNFIQSPKLMQFCAVVVFYMAKRYDEILIACNVNQWDFYNSIIKDY